MSDVDRQGIRRNSSNPKLGLGLQLKYLEDGKVTVAFKSGASKDRYGDDLDVIDALEKKKKISEERARLARAEKLSKVGNEHFIHAARVKRRKAETFSFLESCTTTTSKVYHSIV